MKRWARALYQPGIPLGQDGKRVTGSKEHIALSKEAAKEGMVLVKNENKVLPLAKGTRVALFGKGTFDYVKGGGGSGDVTCEYIRTLYDGLKSKADKVGIFEELCDFYREDIKKQYQNGAVPGMTIEPQIPGELIKKAESYTDTAIISICRFSGEGWDRTAYIDPENKAICDSEVEMTKRAAGIFSNGDFCLSDGEQQMVDLVKEHFDKVIVVMNVGGMVDTSWFAEDDLISSVLFAFQGGMEGGTAAAELLLGEGNPSGKLSDTLAKSLQDYPSSESFHESRDYVDYVEDIYVGYRYFETIPGAREKVNYPFGFGLSYTTFEVKPLEAGENHGNIQVRVQVTNTGSCAGKEVVQIYVGKPQGKLGKPDKELVAFEKTRLLQTGESQLLLLQWKVSDMASFDDLGKVKKASYVLEKGTYVIYAGTSVRDVEKLSYSYVLEEDVITEQLTTKLAPTSLKKRMLADGTFEELPLMQANDPNASEIGKLKDEQTDGFTPEGKLVESYVLWRGMHRSGEHDFTEVADGTITMEEFLAQLSVEELAYLLGGQPNTGVANTFGFGNFPEYGIPDIMTADGPAGLRIAPEAGVNTTAFPCATLLACTWNPEIVERIGEAGGAEVKENNISVWLTPAINIHRSPLCGRNFEYYSEDPLLTAELAGAMVKGIQSNHIGAALKHFACNNKETNRKNCDSRVSERAAREIYLKAVERIVKEQKPWVVMSSYNIMNGHRTSEYKELLTGVLREEWGFGGMVTTDWWTCGEHYKETHAGNDLKMPRGFADRLMEAVRQGCLTREEMETSVGRILKTILKVD